MRVKEKKIGRETKNVFSNFEKIFNFCFEGFRFYYLNFCENLQWATTLIEEYTRGTHYP